MWKRQLLGLLFLTCVFVAFGYLIWSGSSPAKAPHRSVQASQSQSATAQSPSAAVKPASSPEANHPKTETGEFSILGIKPGEALLVLATFFLWWATRDLVKGADRNAQRQLRAYVFPKATVGTVAVGQPFTATVRANNSGQTPAYDMTMIAGLRFRLATSTDPLTLAGYNGPLSRCSIGQNEWSENTVSSGGPLQQNVLNNIMSGAVHVYLLCEIRYRDAFDFQRQTNSRFRLEVAGNQVSWNVEPEGNTAD